MWRVPISVGLWILRGTNRIGLVNSRGAQFELGLSNWALSLNFGLGFDNWAWSFWALGPILFFFFSFSTHTQNISLCTQFVSFDNFTLGFDLVFDRALLLFSSLLFLFHSSSCSRDLLHLFLFSFSRLFFLLFPVMNKRER
jgi:hypothetical protein